MSDITIFEQDGKVYTAISNTMPAKELAKNIAKEIRHMPKIPRARMRVVTKEECLKLPWGTPSRS